MKMEIEKQRMLRIANNRFSESLRDGFRLFKQTYGTLIIPLAIFQVILILLDIFLLTDFKYYLTELGTTYDAIMNKSLLGLTLTEAEWNFLTTFLLLEWILIFLQNLIGAIVITVAMCSVSTYVYKKYMREEVTFMESFKMSFNKRMLWVILIIGIGLPLGSLLLFIPAIIIFGFFIFLVFTFNLEETNNPISEARAISKRSFLKIIGVFMINVIFISVCSYFFQIIFNILLNTDSALFIANYNSWFDPATRNYLMIILFDILMSFVEIALAPLFICLLTTIFSSLKARRDISQGDFYVRRSYREMYPKQIKTYDAVETHEELPKVQLKEKFYCPFCGHFVSTPKKFCPSCGESFSFIQD
jgi:hypothetical protein